MGGGEAYKVSLLVSYHLIGSEYQNLQNHFNPNFTEVR